MTDGLSRIGRRRLRVAALVIAAVGAAIPVSGASATVATPATRANVNTSAATTGQDWPTFLHDGGRSGASGETILNAANAGTLTKKWAYATGGSIVDSAAIVGGVAYVGSWDGYEYALDATTGALIWKTNLGTTTDPNCTYPVTAGVTSAAAVVNGVVYVGGGGPHWYALNASSGAILWAVPTGDNSPAGGHYNWSSPLIYNGNAYIGIASNCDNPLVQGELLKVSLTSHAVVGVTKFAPDGQQGGGIWTSPTVDAATNTIFAATGTINQYTQPLSQAIVAIDATTMAVRDHWQLPFEAETYDSDWGVTPTLTTDTAGRQLLSLANKNGVLYTFARNDLAAGPIWQYQLSPGGECPTCGDGTISSGAFVNSLTIGAYTGPVLFYANGYTMVNGAGYQGSVRAFNPANGALLWAHYTHGPVVGALAYDNGLVIEAQGTTLEVLDATNGRSVYDYLLTQPIYTAPAVSGGQIFIGTNDNNEYAFGLPASPPPAPPPDANCPAGFTCQDLSAPRARGSEVVNSDGSVSVSGAGRGVRNGGFDQMRIVTKPLTGDFQVAVTDVKATGGTINGSLAPMVGIMVRESNDPGAPFYAALQDPTYPYENETVANLLIVYRDRWGSTRKELTQEYPAGFPRSFIVQRRGDSFQTLVSSNGGASYWLIPGTMQDVVMPTTLMAGMAVGSGSTDSLTTLTYRSLVTSSPPTNSYGFLNTTHPCPSGWTCRGVNDPNPPGDQVLNNGAWTLSGAGTGITSGAWQMYGHTDQFHYVYQTVSNDQTIVAQFTGFRRSPPAKAQAGIMVRASTSPTAPYYAILLSGGGGGQVQWRSRPNAVTRTGFIPMPSLAAPVYLRISRYTDKRFTPPVVTYDAATSTDGSSWTEVVGSTAAIDMGGGAAGPTMMGLAATANRERVQVPANFANVSITPTAAVPPGVCPTGWTCADVGNGHVPGNQTDVNHAFTVQASGDLWDVYDQFRYLSEPMKGDGTVSARVLSTQNGGEWQKAGVMIRSDAAAANDPQAPYYAALITPKHGIAVQWRPTEAAPSQQINLPGSPAMFTAPIYLMVARYTDRAHGGTVYYSAYYSADNVKWTVVPGSTMPLVLPADAGGALTAGMAATSYSSNTAVSTFDNFALLGSAPAPPGLCPTAWQCADIGGAQPFGTQVLSKGAWTLSVGGSDLWNASDQFHMDWQTLPADGTVSAHVTAQSGRASWAKGGVILRQSVDPGSAYYGLFVTPGHGTVVQWRATTGATTSQIAIPGPMPTYLMVDRWTNTVSGASTTYYEALTSRDDVTWHAVPGSLMTVTGLSGALLAGLAADSWFQSTANTWSVDTVAVTSQELQPQGACATGWECNDIGGATPAGGQNGSGSTWTVEGGGADIWNASDQFRLVDEPVHGNATVSARVASQTASDPWAKAGVMLRASTAPGAVYYAVVVTPSHGAAVQWRGTAGAPSNSVSIAGTPSYVRVSRWTDTTGATPTTYVTAYTSADGVTWTAVPGSTITMTLPVTTLDGLAVTSHNNAALSTVSFTGVTVTPSAVAPAGICPGNWNCADIGAATPAGAQNDSAGTWTLQGSGVDIWNVSDQFRFVWQPLPGDGSITAHVVSQSDSNPWAKAGVMVRASNDPAAPEYSVLVTPGNGLTVQYRTAQGGTTTALVTMTTATAPIYVRIVRSGTVFSAATSTNGTTWTTVTGSSATVSALSGSILGGLAITSHQTGTLGTAVFDTVTA